MILLNRNSLRTMFDKSLICQNKIKSDIFPVKKLKYTTIKVSFVWLEFCQAKINRADSQTVSQHLKNEACEPSFSPSVVVSLI